MRFSRPLLLIASLLITLNTYSQSNPPEKDTSHTSDVYSKYIGKIYSVTGRLEKKLAKRSKKALVKLERREAKMKKRLERIDSTNAALVFGKIEEPYKRLRSRIQKVSSTEQYIPRLDSFGVSLRFLKQSRGLLTQRLSVKLDGALSKVNSLGNQFQKADEIKTFIQERKSMLTQQLQKLGFARQLRKLNKQAFYYNQQVAEYKAILKDPRKIEQKALSILGNTKLFRDFMRKNSILGKFLPMSGEYGNSQNAGAGFTALQTRTRITTFIQQSSLGSPGAMSQIRQSIQGAQSQLDQLRNKINQIGSGGNITELPDFKPNSQKTRSFFRRLELGANFQSQRANEILPVTTDIGVSVGYKLNDRSIIGIGASYKLGWGNGGWKHIKFSNQGIGLRSFIEWKIKGTLWVRGGYEQNYRTVFTSINQLKDLSAWQQSGLIGISKIISMKSKFFKKSKVQLLWDFLSYHQVPKSRPVLFRIEYNF